MGMVRTAAGFGLVIALKESDNSSLIASITSYKTALVIIGAYIFLKEHDHKLPKLIGASLATVGLLLLIQA